MSNVALPLWRRRVRLAQQRGDAIQAAASQRERRFQELLARVGTASTRAEEAAVSMMRRQDDTTQSVARPYT